MSNLFRVGSFTGATILDFHSHLQFSQPMILSFTRNQCISSLIRLGSLWLMLVVLNSSLQAQDPVFSQFWANKVYLNPAFSGYENGTTFSSSYRSQWLYLDGESSQFTTTATNISFELPDVKSGVSLGYTESKEGRGPLKWQQFRLDYGWRSRPCGGYKRSSNNYELNLGASINYNLWSYQNLNDLTFSDQLDGRLGLTSNQSAFWQTRPQFDQPSYLDFGVGAVLTWQQAHDGIKTETGFAIHHLNQRNQSVLTSQNYRPIRMNIHWQAKIPAYVKGQDVAFYPSAQGQVQPTAYRNPLIDSTRQQTWLFQVGSAMNIMSGQESGIWVGAWWRSRIFPILNDKNAPVPYTNQSLLVGGGVKVPMGGSSNARQKRYLSLGITYDYLMSNKGIFNDGGGTLEIQLGLNFGDLKIGRSCNGICPFEQF